MTIDIARLIKAALLEPQPTWGTPECRMKYLTLSDESHWLWREDGRVAPVTADALPVEGSEFQWQELP